MPKRIPLWEGFTLDEITGCWNWIGNRSRMGSGYGRTLFNGRRELVHRVAAHLWLRFDLKSKTQVLHICDNQACYNPRHLYFGDQSRNIRDCVAKGRHYNASKTICPNGHPYSPENTLRSSNGRKCRICRDASNKRRYQNAAE